MIWLLGTIRSQQALPTKIDGEAMMTEMNIVVTTFWRWNKSWKSASIFSSLHSVCYGIVCGGFVEKGVVKAPYLYAEEHLTDCFQCLDENWYIICLCLFIQCHFTQNTWGLSAHIKALYTWSWFAVRVSNAES